MNRRLEINIINSNYKQGLKWHGSFKICMLVPSAKQSGFEWNQKYLNLLVNTFLTNLKNQSFIAGSKSYGQMNFQKGRYRNYIARENGHFANDLGIRRNHICWVREVKLFLGFKFHNFWRAWQKKMCLVNFC